MERALRVVLRVVSLGLAAANAGADTLTVITYNVGLLKAFGFDLVPLVDARAKAAPREISRLAADARPDIMLLEEIWDDGIAGAIVKELAPQGYAGVKPDTRSVIGLTSGLLLLTKSPLRVEDWKFTPFGRTTFIDSFARKGVLEATIMNTETGARFALLGTHTEALETSNGVPKVRGQLSVFLAQADQILAALRSRSGSGSMPALLLGDMNAGPGCADAAYRKIVDAGSLVEAGAVLFPFTPLVTWDPGNPLVKRGSYPEEPAAKIDHVFLRDGACARWRVLGARTVMTSPMEGLELAPSKGVAGVPVPLSDHYGFLCELELIAAP